MRKSAGIADTLNRGTILQLYTTMSHTPYGKVSKVKMDSKTGDLLL